MADTGTKNQVNIGLRYLGTIATTLFTVLGAATLITPEQAQQLTVALHELNQSILTGYGALLKMWVILGPVGAAVLTTLGIKSGGFKALGAKLLKMATADVPQAASIGGAASVGLPGSVQEDVAKAQVAIANAATAKDVLVAATIGLPQVQAIVADKATADASPSESVVAADEVKVIPAK